ncbi:hypothetical protein B0H14DRAFT_2608659 [Mycena olivaceomarginata]|nr:hypothetical protein B0H14DRAFT_2608659 [Mycena olivaceomarginata]
MTPCFANVLLCLSVPLARPPPASAHKFNAPPVPTNKNGVVPSSTPSDASPAIRLLHLHPRERVAPEEAHAAMAGVWRGVNDGSRIRANGDAVELALSGPIQRTQKPSAAEAWAVENVHPGEAVRAHSTRTQNSNSDTVDTTLASYTSSTTDS